MRNGHASMVRKRYLWRAVIGNFFCLLATASASEPTLQETIDFIQTKVEGHSCEYEYTKATDTPEEKHMFKSSDVTIALLDNKTILVEKRWTYRGQIVPQSRWTTVSTLVKKVRLADLSTDVKTMIPGGTARHIKVNCRKSGCLEWKETNQNRKTVTTFWRYEEEEKFLPDTQGVSSSSDLFTVCNQERAEKIKKALTHAIRISGGKDELF